MAPPKIIGWLLLGMGCMGFGTSVLMLMGMARAKAPEDADKKNEVPFEIKLMDEKKGSWEYAYDDIRHSGFLIAAAARGEACKGSTVENKDGLVYYNIPKFSINGKNQECSQLCEESDLTKEEEQLERALLESYKPICMLTAPKEDGDVELNSNVTVTVIDLTDIPPPKEPINYPLAFTGMGIAVVMLASGAGYLKWWSDKFG